MSLSTGWGLSSADFKTDIEAKFVTSLQRLCIVTVILGSFGLACYAAYIYYTVFGLDGVRKDLPAAPPAPPPYLPSSSYEG